MVEGHPSARDEEPETNQAIIDQVVEQVISQLKEKQKDASEEEKPDDEQ